MNSETLTALITFAFVSSITPGPNNIMLMSSGTNYGFKKSIPHMLGVSIGFAMMATLVGAGLMKLFAIYPIAQNILKFVSISYLVYLSYKIAVSVPVPYARSANQAKALTFLQAALFQWVNPKAWTMALTAITLYAPSNTMKDVLRVAIVFAIVNLPSVSTWVLLGKQFRKVLSSHKKLRIFNFIMATLLLSSLYFVIQ
jgi:threonine/homoserine/homoserine lactone efflux protein